MKTFRIAIADDHPVVCKGIASFIKSNTPHEITFLAQSKEELLKLLKEQPIDVLILDVVLPDVSSTELFSEIKIDYPALSIIAFTSLNSPILIKMLFREGVKAYVNKSDVMKDLLDAIDAIMNDMIYVPEQYRHIIEKKSEPYTVTISKREKEVLLLIAEQLTTTGIAERLFISENTVESHRKKLLEKFQVDNIAGLMREAVKRGYLH